VQSFRPCYISCISTPMRSCHYSWMPCFCGASLAQAGRIGLWMVG